MANRRTAAAALVLAHLMMVGGPARGAELTLADGVVVKFGAGAQLVVRDKLTAGHGVVLTSRQDNSVGGTIADGMPAPIPGDWRGLRVEKSASSSGIVLDDSVIRYGGGQNDAGLTLRGIAPTLRNLQVSDNLVGLRTVDGASPSLPGASFLRNQTGLEADGNSVPLISAGQWVGNLGQAVLNKTPSTQVQATGNWWGHASGPRDSVGNPSGQGDTVSTGVNYGQYLAGAPLVGANLRLAVPAAYYEQAGIDLVATCLNATEYRIAETSNFSGVSFSPFSGGSVPVAYTLSPGDGLKNLYAQFRDAAGNLATANLSSVRLDTQPPAVAILTPAAGSFINQPITVEASAADAAGISRVEFYVDVKLAATVTAAPYTYAWNVDLLPEGDHSLRIVAVDGAGRSSEVVRSVTIGRYIPPPDVTGPQLSNLRLNGVPLVDGTVVTRTSALTVDASDRSGIARVELLLDDQPVAVASGSASYSASLVLDNVSNGPHTLTWRGVDSVGNSSTQSVAITVTHALPSAPVLTAPVNGLLTREATQILMGTAPAGSQIQALVNDAPVGVSATVGSDGRFSVSVTLVNGANKLQAKAIDAYGESPLSGAITVTLDTSVPVAPSSLIATSQVGGKIHLTWSAATDSNTVGYYVYRSAAAFSGIGEALKVNATALKVTSYDDMPTPDGIYYYRVVAANRVGTLSNPSNQAQGQGDSTLPRAESVVYAPQGKVDVASGRIGQGRVGVTVNVSEALSAVPYLSIVPSGGTPIPVDLIKVSDLQYTGAFVIDAATPSGMANALFSARDVVGNRGTEIKTGGSLKIDTEGPALTGIVLTPAAPIKAESGGTALSATFTLSKAMKTGEVPLITWQLSGPVRTPTPVAGLVAVDSLTWRGSVALPGDAGLGSPETLSFAHRGIDDLDNISTKVSAPVNRFQVYQGNLPPLGTPGGLTAKAQPGGKVQLAWQAVPDAFGYQVYRQAPGEAALTAYQRASGTSYLDTVPQDGAYRYAVASIRNTNGQESLSDPSAPVDVTASATAPGAPQALALALTGQGIRATWQAPLASVVASYNLYRSTGTSLTSTQGLTPIRTGIKDTVTLDTAPNPNASAYAVTALDAAGNESAPSESRYLNASLLPVKTLSIQQIGDSYPLVGWTAPNGNLAGYNVYLGPDAGRVKLTPSPITGLSYTDTGYSAGERRYTVASVDSNANEIGRSLVLPNISTQIISGLPIKRGIFNLLQVQVSNTSSAAQVGTQALVRLGNKDHRSAAVTLGSNETRLLPVVVGGYADLTGQSAAQVGVEIVPAEGEFVKIARNQTLDVTDGALVVGISTEAFTRGATGKVRITIENTSDVEVEFLTARNSGNDVSDELRFKLLDPDGNILSTQAYKQGVGLGVVTLASGRTVARIAPGAKYVSDAFDLTVPGASPDQIKVRLEIDKLRYHTGQADEILLPGRTAEATVSLADTAYIGEVTDVTPVLSFGDKTILITGRALDRTSRAPLPSKLLKLILNQQGFERSYPVTTDASGSFTYSFKPTVTDGGLFKVSAIHPDLTDRPEQKAFTIDRVVVGPTPYNLTVPRNYPYNLPFRAQSGAGTAASGLRLVLDPASQPTGTLPTGITLQLPAPTSIGEKQSVNLPVLFTADNTAQASGRVILDAWAAENPAAPIGKITLNYTLQQAQPNLVSTPSFIETGLAQGGSQIESLQVKNTGLQDALDLAFSLTNPDGSPAPTWVSIASAADGSLAVGATRSIDIAFNPSSVLAEGVYQFRLKVVGSNVPAQNLNVYASVTQSGQGSILFKAADIYTATVDKNGNLIQGLAGASITVQNEDVATITRTLTTDVLGEALFQNLPAGNYKYRIGAKNHQEIAGRFQIKPGITQTQPVFLDYNVVTVTWSVKEVTIQDRYDITLNTTFQADVPAPVVVLEPASVNLPKMVAGNIYSGELTLTNYGLVRADHVRQKLPTPDAYFRYEFLVQVPETLEAKQRVTIPYRIIALQSLDAPSGSASGGGCYSYSGSMSVPYDYTCANGATSTGSTTVYWTSASNSTCSGSGGGGGVGGIGGSWGGSSGGGGGGSFGGGSAASFTDLKGLPPCITCQGEETKPPCATCGAK